jgi:hypothetical protein
MHKEIFSVYGGKCLSRKAVCNWVENYGKHSADDEEVETGVQKWLRQQSKDFYLVRPGFDAVVKSWDECISVNGGYIEK